MCKVQLSERDIEIYIGSWRLIPSKGGVFEVTVNGELVYSKKATGRHAQPGEIRAAILAKLAELRGEQGQKPSGPASAGGS
jgi:selenoprotein W-related protein